MSRTLTLVDGEREHQVEILDSQGSGAATSPSQGFGVAGSPSQGFGAVNVRVGERTFEVRRNGDGAVRIMGDRPQIAWTVAAGDVRWVFIGGRLFQFGTGSAQPRRRGSGHHGTLTAPMPATVRRVLVSAGDQVARGDTLIVLEAMKMELPVRAGASGTVTAIHCHEGQLVQPGLTLIDLDEG